MSHPPHTLGDIATPSWPPGVDPSEPADETITVTVRPIYDDELDDYLDELARDAEPDDKT
ncbi:MAG: hypothetical protein ACRDWD_15945 [Acidimicrobiia bacterium]